MQFVTLMELKKDKKMWELFKYNSYWIKELNRNPASIKNYREEMKAKYKLRTTDKINSAIDNIDMISSVLSVLK